MMKTPKLAFLINLARAGQEEPSLRGMVDWVSQIPFEAWPQQTSLADGKIRPAMVNDPAWRSFGTYADPLVGRLMPVVGGFLRGFHEEGPLHPYNPMLSVVMPGARIEPHRDLQSPHWVTRVHVPLATNEQSFFVVGGTQYWMPAGSAFLVDVSEEHEVINDGETPRVHFMFDVLRVAGM